MELTKHFINIALITHYSLYSSFKPRIYRVVPMLVLHYILGEEPLIQCNVIFIVWSKPGSATGLTPLYLSVPPPNRAYLRTLIHNADLEHLEKVVLDGHGHVSSAVRNRKQNWKKTDIFKLFLKFHFRKRLFYLEIQTFTEIAWRKFRFGQGREIPGCIARLHGKRRFRKYFFIIFLFSN